MGGVLRPVGTLVAISEAHVKEMGWAVCVASRSQIGCISRQEFPRDSWIHTGQEQLTSAGKGYHPNRAESIIDREEEHLWQCGFFD